MKRIAAIAATLALMASPAVADNHGENPDKPLPAEEVLEEIHLGPVVPAGMTVPLVMVNSISSKHSRPGDPVYLESVYPVVVDGEILIPPGTHVSGSVLFSKRPGRIKGRGQLSIRFEQMILPYGTIISLLGRPGMLDGRSQGKLDRETGAVTSEGGKGGDAADIATTTATGASVGTLAGASAGRTGTGAAIGAAAGAAAGLAMVLLTRGPEATLSRGTHVEMLLERDIHLGESGRTEQPELRRRGEIGRGPEPNSGNSRRGRLGGGRIGGLGR